MADSCGKKRGTGNGCKQGAPPPAAGADEGIVGPSRSGLERPWNGAATRVRLPRRDKVIATFGENPGKAGQSQT